MTTTWRQRQRAKKMKWQNKQPYLKNKYSMYNLLCVLIKINRQSITCLLREVFTTIHRHGGRTLAQEDTDREDRWRDDLEDKVVEKKTKQLSVWVNMCLNPVVTEMHWEGRRAPVVPPGVPFADYSTLCVWPARSSPLFTGISCLLHLMTQ